MRIDIITIFPDYFAPLELSLIGKARAAGILDVHLHDLRSWTYDRHNTVDDTPYGGGPGMVMKPEPWGEALDAVVAARASSPCPARRRRGGRRRAGHGGDAGAGGGGAGRRRRGSGFTPRPGPPP